MEEPGALFRELSQLILSLHLWNCRGKYYPINFQKQQLKSWLLPYIWIFKVTPSGGIFLTHTKQCWLPIACSLALGHCGSWEPEHHVVKQHFFMKKYKTESKHKVVLPVYVLPAVATSKLKTTHVGGCFRNTVFSRARQTQFNYMVWTGISFRRSA